MNKVIKLKIAYWVLLCIASIIFAVGFPSWDAKGFVLPITAMVCCIYAGYIDRIIDEEKI